MLVGGSNVIQKDVDVIFSLTRLRGPVDAMKDILKYNLIGWFRPVTYLIDQFV